MSTGKKKVIRKTAPILGAAAAAVGIALIPAVVDAAPIHKARIHKARHVLAGYQNVRYRRNWYDQGYHYGGPAHNRWFWGKGS